MDGDELALSPESHRRGFSEIFKTTQGCVQIGKGLSDILVKVRNAVKG
jgi:hypothetical protein